MSETLIYTTHAHSRNGRNGHAETRNNVSTDLEMPRIANGVSRKGATTPEDLFAAAWSACFGATLEAIMRAEHSEATIERLDLTVNLNRSDTGTFDLSAGFAIAMRGIDQSSADELVQSAHRACPYSRAIRNNVDVSFDVKSL